MFNWKFWFIFVMAWFWFIATQFKPRNVISNICSEIPKSAYLLSFRNIFSNNCNRNFCVKMENWTEVSPKYCVKNRICVNKENWTQFCQNILLEKPISLENEKRNQILSKIIVEKRNFSEYGNPGRSLLVKSNFTWNLTNEKKFYVKKARDNKKLLITAVLKYGLACGIFAMAQLFN